MFPEIGLRPSAGDMGPLLMVAVIFLAGVTGGWVAHRLRIPTITGNIVAGVLLGPAGVDLFQGVNIAEALQPLSTFAMGLISVTVGGHLSYRRIHNALRRITLIAVCEVAGAVTLVVGATRMLGAEWPTALLLGVVAAATAPATTMALIRESRAKGSFVKTLVSVVALDNIMCIVLFAFAQGLLADYFASGEIGFRLAPALSHAAWQLLGAMMLGVGLAFFTIRIVHVPATHDFTTIFLAVLLLTGLASYLAFSPLLTCLFFGIYFGNSSKESERTLRAIEPLEMLVYTSFFTIAGVSLHLETLAYAGSLCAGYLVARVAGKGLGAMMGGVLARSSARIWKNMPIALVPQAGVAIGLIVLLEGDERIPSDVAHLVSTLVLAAVTVNEIVGPFTTRLALRRAKEAGLDRPRLMEFMQEEFILTGMKARDKWEAIEKLADFFMRSHRYPRATRDDLLRSIKERENERTTAVGHGVAIPHGRTEVGDGIQGVLGICHEGVEFDAPDGEPVKLMMLVVTPRDHEKQHLEVMASLASMVRDPLVRTRLVSAIDANDAWEVIESEETRGYNYFLEQDEQTSNGESRSES